MTTNPKTDRLPTEAELAEPDRRLDGLIAFLRRQNDAVEMARWFVDAVADAFRLPLVVGHPDPVEHWGILSAAALWALHSAATSRSLRKVLVKAAVGHVQELLEQVLLWKEESEQEPPHTVQPLLPARPPKRERKQGDSR